MATTEERLAECEQRGKSNTHRLDKIEKDQEAISQLATSVAVMAEQQKHTVESMDRMGAEIKDVSGKVDTLEKLPGRRWEAVVDKALTVLVAAIVGFLLARMGMAA